VNPSTTARVATSNVSPLEHRPLSSSGSRDGRPTRGLDLALDRLRPATRNTRFASSGRSRSPGTSSSGWGGVRVDIAAASHVRSVHAAAPVRPATRNGLVTG
jgi:hypothetical protein